MQEEEYNYNPADQCECRKCGRNFGSDRIDKHEKVCKVNAKPRKVHLFHKPAPPPPHESGRRGDRAIPVKPPPKWKQQHEDLVNSMQYNRKLAAAEKNGIDIRTLPPPPSSGPDLSLVPCPFCGRRFGEQQAERHIPKCKNTINKPAPPPGKSKPMQQSQSTYSPSSGMGGYGMGGGGTGNGKSVGFSGVKKGTNVRRR
jgi:hypothetical protein